MLDPQNASYHHGNVKSDLISAALKLMEVEDIEGLSLRRLAREIGITPAAVYNHFADKQSLMRAIRSRAFKELNDFFDANFSNDTDPELAFTEICKIYYDYSRKNQTHFEIMFGGKVEQRFLDENSSPIPCSIIANFRRVMAELYLKFDLPCTKEFLDGSCILMWAQLHGLIVLLDSGSLSIAMGSIAGTQEDQDQQKGKAFETIDTIINQMTYGFYLALKNRRAALDRAENPAK